MSRPGLGDTRKLMLGVGDARELTCRPEDEDDRRRIDRVGVADLGGGEKGASLSMTSSCKIGSRTVDLSSLVAGEDPRKATLARE